MTDQNPALPPTNRLLQLAGIFFKIGSISFGGPMALIAIMEEEFVQKRKWLSQEHFLDLVAATNMVPGPNACEMAAHIGFVRAGYPGLVVAELSFFLPAVVLSSLLGVVYVRYGSLPQVDALFYGINPVILALILMATYRLGKTTLTSRPQFLVFGLALLASFLDVNEVIIIFGSGLLAMLISEWPRIKNKGAPLLLFFPLFYNSGAPLKFISAAADNVLLKLFLFFLKTGSLIFGSGMVLFTFIHEDIVERLGWLTEQQLIDAIAVGQMTPGPVTSTSAFIGYLIAGWPGAAVSALGNFLPSFIIVAAIGPLIPKMRQSRPLQALLRGINAAVIALMISICLTIAKNAVVDMWTLLVVLASVAILFFYKVDSIWLVLGGALIGLLRYFVG
ncbi:MAG: chromate efflux transporter [Anaerolineaceae bacterium]